MNSANCFQARKLALSPFSGESFDLTTPKGAVTAFLGKNGAGKTTLLRAILGEPVISGGAVFLMDRSEPVGRWKPREIAHTVAFVAQEHLYPMDLKVEDFLRLAFLPKAGYLFGKIPKTTIEMETIAIDLGIDRHFRKLMRDLSTGERQRVFLARAILQEPKLLLLDEPTNHLDPGARKTFWEILLKTKAKKGLELLISTHDLDFVRDHADWVVGMIDGRPVFSLRKTEVTKEHLETLYREVSDYPPDDILK